MYNLSRVFFQIHDKNCFHNIILHIRFLITYVQVQKLQNINLTIFRNDILY